MNQDETFNAGQNIHRSRAEPGKPEFRVRFWRSTGRRAFHTNADGAQACGYPGQSEKAIRIGADESLTAADDSVGHSNAGSRLDSPTNDGTSGEGDIDNRGHAGRCGDVAALAFALAIE